MKTKRQFLAIVVACLAVIVAGVLLTRGWNETQRASQESEATQWTCSMHPQIRMDHPGRCPICGMALISVAQLTAEQAKRSAAAPLETEAVAKRELFKEVRTVGKFDYNERRVASISARVAGRVDRVYADFTGVEVRPHDHLLDIYSPDLYSAQQELILAVDATRARPGAAQSVERPMAQQNLESARRKLLLLGLLQDQIDEIEKNRKIHTHVTIYAPIGGVVIEKSIREGQYVKDGDPLYRIADLDPIWLYVNIYEYDLGWVRHGQKVDVTLQAYPGETFHGLVTFIDPFLDDMTRTVKVRVNLHNTDRRIKPQMYATAVIHVRLAWDGTPEPTGLEGKYICPMHPEVVRDEAGECPLCGMPLERVPEQPKKHDQDEHAENSAGVLAIPASAVLDTGLRRIAYRLTDSGEYELVELRLGPRVEGVDEKGTRRAFYPVLDGLKEGEPVVVQGGFLLDSQRQIEGMPSLLYPEGSTASSQLHAGHGGGAPSRTSGQQPSPQGTGHQH